MSQDNRKMLVTAALPYANGAVHIGHLAGCYLPADIFVRYQRANNKDVKFICGSDEHGVPITIRAMKEGVSPQEIVDRYHEIIKKSFEDMGISFDIYSRTTTDIHRQTAQEFFKDLYDKGIFEERESEQFYDEEKNMFLADRYIIGTCPVCGNDSAYGDQCEKCGSSLSPEQLINPRSALSSAPLKKKKTKHWYFPLNNYQEFLEKWIIEGKKDQWKPNVYGQCKSWLDNGLQPRAMTRDSSWGVPVPLPDAEGKVLYVWFDAPIGYISNTKELIPLTWDSYWKNENTRLVHFIGKDNIVFHCLIFPAMLKAHGGYVLPENVPANEFLNIEGKKVSTSRNWAVWVDEYLNDFPEMQDTLRYVLCANAPETKDNDFTWKEFQNRNNNELVAIFGNFVNRAMVMMHKLCNGRVPLYHAELQNEVDMALIKEIIATKKNIETCIESYRFRDGIFEVIELARKGNKYLQDIAPWLLAKTPELQAENQAKIDNCIHISLQLCANLAIYCNPFLPFTARKICHMLKVVHRMLEWENGGQMNLIKERYPLRPPELLFRKIEDKEMEQQRNKLIEQSKQAEAEKIKQAGNAEVPDEAAISFNDFAKVKLKNGLIKSAEKMEKSNKLLKLEVDLGSEMRTILSGIGEYYQPEEIVNRQVTVVSNLQPRKMMGIMSEGMILMTEDENGKLVFVNASETVQPGAEIR